jgi:LysM repeat protein
MTNTITYILLTVLSFTTLSLYAQDNDLFYHTVERGQTIYSIAVMYGVAESDLYRLNPASREVIKVGEKLKVPQKKADSTTFHTIQPKETLYSLSVKYNVPAEAIVEANPGLSVTTFLIGKNIRIPSPLSSSAAAPPQENRVLVKEIEYKVERRETLYRISRKFNVSSDDLIARNPQLKNGVKAGMRLIIPVKEEALADQQKNTASEEKNANALLSAPVKMDKPDTIKAVLILPFMVEEGVPGSNTSRFIEYYEGMLLAIDSLRNQGISIKLTVRDCGNSTKKLNEILKENALREAHLIIGAVENEQIAPIASFAKKNEIRYVIPFTSKNDDVLSNPYIFQVNTPHSYLYAKATQAAYEMFYDYNIIFVETNDQDDKMEFIRIFRQELSQHNIAYKDLLYREESFYTDLEAMLRRDKRNVIIPASGTLEALNKIRTPLRTFVEANPDCLVNLFGYPEWQTYVRECLEDFFVLNTYIYSNFYADNLSPEVARFNSRYKIWFSKNPANTFPKFGIWGFDTGMFFLNAIAHYGINFETSFGKINYKSLQTGFKFYRVNNWGGFVNTNLFIIHYNKENYRIIRHELK